MASLLPPWLEESLLAARRRAAGIVEEVRGSVVPPTRLSRYMTSGKPSGDRVLAVLKGNLRRLDVVVDRMMARRQEGGTDGQPARSSSFGVFRPKRPRGRGFFQRLLHVHMCRICLKSIYGEEFQARLPAIMEKEGISSHWTNLIVKTPRRWGKTQAVAQFVAALLCSIPGPYVTSIFSSSLRASSTMLGLIKDYFYALSPAGFTAKDSQDRFAISYGASSGWCKVFSYPSNVRPIFDLTVSPPPRAMGNLWCLTSAVPVVMPSCFSFFHAADRLLFLPQARLSLLLPSSFLLFFLFPSHYISVRTGHVELNSQNGRHWGRH